MPALVSRFRSLGQRHRTRKTRRRVQIALQLPYSKTLAILPSSDPDDGLGVFRQGDLGLLEQSSQRRMHRRGGRHGRTERMREWKHVKTLANRPVRDCGGADPVAHPAIFAGRLLSW